MSFSWVLAWWPHALRHGLDPFVTDQIWSGAGFNLTWATSVPTLSLLAAPVTALAGPLFTYNLLIVLGPAIAAWTAYLLARDVTGKLLPSVAAGMAFGFSPYISAQTIGHLNLTFVGLVPLAVLLCKRRIERRMTSRGFVVALAATAFAQLGISTEVLATSALFGAMAWLVFLATASRGDRGRWFELAFDVVKAGLATIVVASPFLFRLVRGMSIVPTQMNDPEYYPNDLLAFILPTQVMVFGGSLFSSITRNFPGNLSEQNGYIGLPLLLIAGWFVYCRAAQSRIVRRIVICAAIAAVCSLGGHPHVGQTRAAMPLPWLVPEHLPFLTSVLPARLSLFTMLGLSVLLALFLAERATLWRVGVVVVSLLCLFPERGLYAGATWPTDPFFTPAHIRARFGADPVLLILPFGDQGPDMAYQVNAGNAFRQSGGYLGYVPRSEAADPIVPMLLQGQVDARFHAAFPGYVRRHRVTAVIVGPGTPDAVAKAIAEQHWPTDIDGDMVVVHVPENAR